jgi:monoamine oxidase
MPPVLAETAPRVVSTAVIGGGPSGLSSLDELVSQGVTDAELFEAEERLGGRVWTERGTPYYERGAELVNSTDTHLLSLLKRLNIPLVERRFFREKREDIFLFRERKWTEHGLELGQLKSYHLSELVELMKKNPADVAALERIQNLQNHRTRYAEEIRTWKASEVVKGSDLVSAVCEALMRSEMGVPLAKVDAEVLLDYLTIDPETMNIELIPGSDEKYRIVGGSDSFVRKLVEKHRSRVHGGTALTKVSRREDGRFNLELKKVDGTKEKVIANQVVMAVPAHAMKHIDIEVPGITKHELREAEAMPFAKNTKIFLTFRERFWQSSDSPHAFRGEGLTESGVQFWETTEDQDTKKPVITLYPGDWPENEEESRRRLEKILKELTHVPGFERLQENLVSVDKQIWKQSYAGVFNSKYPDTPVLFEEQPPKGIVFVGSDKDLMKDGSISATFGYMEGALRSARRGVETLIQQRGLSMKVRCEAVFTGGL